MYATQILTIKDFNFYNKIPLSYCLMSYRSCSPDDKDIKTVNMKYCGMARLLII